jgi:hypothetical protein
MQVADSTGASAPSMLVAAGSGGFGLALMYAQQFENSRQEGIDKGLTPEEASKYGQNRHLPIYHGKF